MDGLDHHMGSLEAELKQLQAPSQVERAGHLKLGNAPSTAGNSMTGSERPLRNHF